MQTETGLRRGRRDLGEHLVAPGPGGRDALEGGAVGEARVGEPVVEVADRCGDRPVRRPDREVRAGAGRDGQQAARVPDPRLVALGARVDRHRAVPGGVGLADHDLELHAAPLGQDQRRFQGQLLQPVTAGRFARGLRASSTKAVPGSRTTPMTAWSASHGCGGQGQAAGVDEAVPGGQRHGRAEQRVPGRADPQPGRAARRSRAGP